MQRQRLRQLLVHNLHDSSLLSKENAWLFADKDDQETDLTRAIRTVVVQTATNWLDRQSTNVIASTAMKNVSMEQILGRDIVDKCIRMLGQKQDEEHFHLPVHDDLPSCLTVNKAWNETAMNERYTNFERLKITIDDSHISPAYETKFRSEDTAESFSKFWLRMRPTRLHFGVMRDPFTPTLEQGMDYACMTDSSLEINEFCVTGDSNVMSVFDFGLSIFRGLTKVRVDNQNALKEACKLLMETRWSGWKSKLSVLDIHGEFDNGAEDCRIEDLAWCMNTSVEEIVLPKNTSQKWADSMILANICIMCPRLRILTWANKHGTRGNDWESFGWYFDADGLQKLSCRERLEEVTVPVCTSVRVRRLVSYCREIFASNVGLMRCSVYVWDRLMKKDFASRFNALEVTGVTAVVHENFVLLYRV